MIVEVVTGILSVGFMYVTSKLAPSLPKAEVETRSVSLESTITTGVYGKSAIEPLTPFTVTVQFVKVASPKSARVLIWLSTVGRSTIHSAHFIEELYVTVFWNIVPLVWSSSFINQEFWSKSSRVMVVVILSPG